MILFLSLLLVIPPAFCTISVELNCTVYKSGVGLVYAPQATGCDNGLPDDVCEALFEKAPNSNYPAPGGSDQRPLKCFASDGGSSIDHGWQEVGLIHCPKTCGYCCLTPRYNCQNADVLTSRVDCSTVTPLMCDYPAWRDILAADCPATCGLCKLNFSTD